MTLATAEQTCPGLQTGDCEVLSWDDDGNVTARDTKTGEVKTLLMEGHCPVIEAAKHGKKE
jgi:hypothetical protein